MERVLNIPSFDEFTEIRLETLDSATLHVPKGGRIFMNSLGPCLGVVGYDFRHRIIFGNHLTLQPGIEEEIERYLKNLKQSGVQYTRVAIAGGNIQPKVHGRLLDDFPKLVEIKNRLHRMPGITSYINPEEIAPTSRADYLDVIYQKGRFRINYEKGDVGGPGFEPGLTCV